jgi:ubiquinone biosynthesis protein COQ4
MSIYSHSVVMRNPIPMLKLLYASVKLVKNPKRLDEVIDLADNISDPEVMQTFVDTIAKDAQGARALREKPRVHIDLAAFDRLPVGTLGREFAALMRAAGLDPADLPHRPANDEHEFVRAHLFETHDIWHVVTGFKTDEAGELGLQAFYLAQLPARLSPLLLGIGMVNTFAFSFEDARPRMDEIARGWQLGKRAGQLFGTDWNALWDRPLAEVRAGFGITPADAAGRSAA